MSVYVLWGHYKPRTGTLAESYKPASTSCDVNYFTPTSNTVVCCLIFGTFYSTCIINTYHRDKSVLSKRCTCGYVGIHRLQASVGSVACSKLAKQKLGITFTDTLLQWTVRQVQYTVSMFSCTGHAKVRG